MNLVIFHYQNVLIDKQTPACRPQSSQCVPTPVSGLFPVPTMVEVNIVAAEGTYGPQSLKSIYYLALKNLSVSVFNFCPAELWISLPQNFREEQRKVLPTEWENDLDHECSSVANGSLKQFGKAIQRP